MNAIVVVDQKWAIGREGGLLFSLPTDMKRFRALTLNGTVILGRKTLDTFPGGRPLPKRRNIVISHQTDLEIEGAELVGSLEEALKAAGDLEDDHLWVIGGGSVKILFDNFETYYNSAAKWATEFWEGLNLSDEVTARAVEISNKILDNVEVFTTNLAPKLLGYTFNAVSTVADILLALAFSIYAILDKNRLLAHSRRFVRSVFNEKHSSGILEVFSYANLTFRGYFAGQITSCTIIGILCYIGMRIMNMPFPEMISVFIAVFAMIPILGPWLSTIPSAFIILMTSPGKPELVLYFVIMIIIIQQIDNNLVYPRVVGDAVGLSSAWVLGAVILGSGLFGIAGLIFAVPVTAVLYRLLADWTNERARQRGVPIIDTVPGVKYDLRGHVRRSFKKKKNNASSGSGRLRTKETKTETGETAAADKAGRTEKSENENSDNK